MSVVAKNVTGMKLTHTKRKVSTPRSEEGSYNSEGVSSGFSAGYGDDQGATNQYEEDDQYEDDEEEGYRKRPKA
jgi:hypothetical protein